MTHEQARQTCERRRWEYRRGYIFDGWQYEVTPTDGDAMRDDLASTGRTLSDAVRAAQRMLELTQNDMAQYCTGRRKAPQRLTK